MDDRLKRSASRDAALLDRLFGRATEPYPPPRCIVVAAHPDDEVVGLGGHLPRLRESLFLYTTDGAPRDMADAHAHGFATREDYAAARRAELMAALALAGVEAPEQRVRWLGCADQEAALDLGGLGRRIARFLSDYRPEVVITHPYEGGHPDHDATAFAVHSAAEMASGAVAPRRILEMTSYHNGPNGLTAGAFLPYWGADEVEVRLSAEQRDLKHRLMECYSTQRNTLQYFAVDAERFRVAPRYDFTRPPHEGLLFYEMYPWGMTGRRLCELASEALTDLGFAVRPAAARLAA